MPPQNSQLIDEHVFLMGRPPIGEFFGFVRTKAMEGHSVDLGHLAEEWRLANDHVVTLEKTEAGFADNPPIHPISQDFSNLVQQVKDTPSFQRTMQLFPSEFAAVELDRLVVFQKNINLGFVADLKTQVGNNPTSKAVFQLALALNRVAPEIQLFQNAQNIYSFISPSNDFRFLEATIVKSDQIINHPVSAGLIMESMLGLAVGYTPNYLHIYNIEDRLVLINGSHRAFALRDLGVTHAPCVIQKISRRDELELAGIPDLLQNPDRYLKAPRPPLLKDYFDPLLRKIVNVPRKNRLVKLSFGLETVDIEAI